MARSITYREAINEAIAQEMERDERVIVMGEDNAGGAGSPGEDDAWGGVLGVTKGLYGRFPGRVLDTPISESAFIGAAIGAATGGLRPVAELMFIDFMGVCFDQIYNQAAKFRYMFGGKAVTPVVIRTMWGAGLRAAAQHSQSLLPVFTHVPGLKVAAPSNPYDAKGLLIQAIRDDDPVIFAEHKMLYDVAGEVPEESYAIPFGEANIVKEGGDVTIVAFGRMVNTALEAAEELASSGTEAEIIDPRTTSRWTPTRSSSRWRTPGGSWWSTSPTRAARWPATSPGSSRRRRSGRCGRRSSRSPAHTRRCRSPTRWRTCSSPTPRVAAAVKTVVGYAR